MVPKVDGVTFVMKEGFLFGLKGWLGNRLRLLRMLPGMFQPLLLGASREPFSASSSA